MSETRYDSLKLKKFVTDVMESRGVPHEDAALFAESLINANMRGINSHGITRLKTYYDRLAMGLVNPKPEIKVLSEMPGFMVLDADNGMGVPTASWAMKQCIERAKTTGACFAAVRGGNHYGYAGFFCEQASAEGMIGFSMTNAPSAVAPFGGKTGQLGTNPIAISVPRVGKDPVMMDMATSIVARGKVKLARKEGHDIPLGWSIDENGNGTTDPFKAVTMLPLGGYKGYALGVMIEILVSCIAGAKTSMNMGEFYDMSGKTHQELGYFVGAINLAGVVDMEAFTERVDALCAELKNSPRADGVEEIHIPEEIEYAKHRQAEKEGITIAPAIVKEIEEVSAACGVPFRCEM